ncbi:poly(A) RNA polymerase gld-2 homolog B-like [Sabethes cyaneus]|uniref:poly(A) RNA polymerase gld-2 homolog B-like n=1 Tax=Sabethes cyaneus TaxID=53552 RepID=UPI00237E93FF|nr:poly(A) RNA polymerase gld-2 homolog B-like [Sabethes cyaneus]XP_053695203.1 poly(A) RNA polymerase gld-2 homolog B-like [Sabethes cyaneus]
MSTKRMHPPAALQAAAQTGVKGGLLPSPVTACNGKSANYNATISTKNRHNVENIVPSQKGIQKSGSETPNQQNGAESVNGLQGAVKKSIHRSNPVPASKMQPSGGPVGASAISTLNTINRRKNNRINSPNRKRQEIFSNLRAYNVELVPSVNAQSDKQDVGGTNPESLPVQMTAAPSAGNEAGKANSENSGVTCPSTSTSIVSSNTSINSNSSNVNSSSSSSNICSSKSSKKKDYPLMIAATATTVVSKDFNTPVVAKPGGTAEAESKTEACTITSLPNGPDKGAPFGGTSTNANGQKKLLNASGSFSTYHRHPALLSSNEPSSVGSAVPSTTSTTSSVSSVAPPSSCTPESAAAPTNGGVSSSKPGSPRSNSNTGKVLLQSVNPPPSTAPLDPMTLLQGKLRSSLKIDNFATPPPQTHHIAHHSTISLHQPPGQPHSVQPQQQQQQQHIPPTTSPQYTLDFLHMVGMRMSTAGGGVPANSATTAPTAMFRASPPFNYTFNLQQQQQQMIHQQIQQQQQSRHQHVQRHFSHYYDDLVMQNTGGGEPVYPSFVVPAEHLTNGANSANGNASINTSGGSSNDTGLAYCYSQNHHHHLHHSHPGQQSGYGQHQNHYQNNNYQQHNRNYSRGGQHNGSGNPSTGGKRSWNNNWHNGKKGNVMHGKYGNKNSSFNHGYRKNYHFHNNHHNNNHQQQYEQYQNHQSDNPRNLVYIRGYDRGHRNSGSHKSVSRSPTPSPQSESPSIDESGESGDLGVSIQPQRDEKSDSGIDEVVQSIKKCTAPGSSSSSSSMASIPSTDSSAVSSSVSQNLELHCAAGPGYESDSSHSSSYNSHSYRPRKYASNGQVYRSSSSTSSGVSSTAAFPPISTATTTTPQVADFFLRSQSYHGSHQNLVTVSGGTSPNPPSSPAATPRSLVGTQSMPMFSELFTGTHHNLSHQQHQLQPQLLQQQQQPHLILNHQPQNLQNALYGSSNSLELSIHTGTNSTLGNSTVSNCSGTSNGSSSGYSSAPPSTVPPNEVNSMQSGHPKRRHSGRSSPVYFTVSNKPNRTLSGNVLSVASAQQQQPPPSSSPPSTVNSKDAPAWSQHRPLTVSASTVTATSTAPISQPPPTFSLSTNSVLSFPPPNEANSAHTPADKFLARMHLVEMLAPPEDFAPPGCKWAPLSRALWQKFAAAQQTQHKYAQKIHLWRYLFLSIRKAFPRFSLYMVGSTIAGYASDNSDVDMCLVCRSNSVPFDMRGEALFQLGQLKNYFMNISTFFEEFSVIQAKVPILRFRDATSSVVVDLNYNNCVGIRNTHLLFCYSQLDWRVRPLTLVAKMWAQHHNINDAKNMTISSYSLVLMVIHFLQYGVSPPILPCLHAMYPDKFVRMSDISSIDLTETMEPYKNENSMPIGELFLQFLEYYANFDYTHYAISVRTGSVISIESARVARSYKNDPHHWRQLCIEEPFDLTNTARSVFDADIFEQIKSVFSTCWRRLKDTNDLNSIFDCEPLFIPVASALSLTS